MTRGILLAVTLSKHGYPFLLCCSTSSEGKRECQHLAGVDRAFPRKHRILFLFVFSSSSLFLKQSANFGSISRFLQYFFCPGDQLFALD
jgi:hypothetical protein